jgi:hypothetical protein
MLSDQHQHLHRREPCRRVVLALRQLGDVGRGVAQGAQLTAIGQWDGTASLSVEPELPASLRRQVDQLRELDGQSPSIVPDVGHGFKR